ncbi:MAG: hypothetical protein HYZ45_08355 [Burkholderiales bacterium]|nr:hypothetical protein [Burkholderiales bacterium]
MNKRQVLLAAAIASLAMVNVAHANEVTSISDVAVVSQAKEVLNACKGTTHSCAGSVVQEVSASCKSLANDCSGKTGVASCGAWLE